MMGPTVEKKRVDVTNGGFGGEVGGCLPCGELEGTQPRGQRKNW